MSDAADITDERMERELQLLIHAARRVVPEGVRGECIECEETSPRLIKGVCATCRDRAERMRGREHYKEEK